MNPQPKVKRYLTHERGQTVSLPVRRDSAKRPFYRTVQKLSPVSVDNAVCCVPVAETATLCCTGLGRDRAFRGAAALPCPGSVFGFTSIKGVLTEMTITASAIIPQASRRPDVYNQR